jgi:hypothetical protein
MEKELLENARKKCEELIREIREEDCNTELTRILAIQKMNLINVIKIELYE